MLTAGPQIPQIWLLSWKSQEKHKKCTVYGDLKQVFKFVYDIEAQENGKNEEKKKKMLMTMEKIVPSVQF